MKRVALGVLVGLVLVGSVGVSLYRWDATPPAIEAEATAPVNPPATSDLEAKDITIARSGEDRVPDGAIELVASKSAPPALDATETEPVAPIEEALPEAKPADAGAAGPVPAAPLEQAAPAMPMRKPTPTLGAEPQAPITTQSLDANKARAAPRVEEDETDIADAPIPRAKLERMIGQMIIVGFVGTRSSDPGVVAVQNEIKNGVVGGVMLLQRNVRSPQQVRALNDGLRRAGGSFVPLISVDQEGGEVQRLTPRNGHRSFPSAQQVGSMTGADPGGRAMTLYGELAAELKADGFNVNFGPDVDLNTNPRNPIIGELGRSYGADPKRVADYGRWFSLAHHQADVLTAAKHFPGHGSSRTDSHVTFTDISQTWKPIELKPFRDLAKEQAVDMIMVGHLYHPQFSDGPGIPASLSKKAMDALRQDIGFKGVIVSDDMEMGALRENFSFEDRIVKAISAGTDLLIFANRIPAPQNDLGARIHAVILNAVNSGKIPPERIEQSYTRVMKMKAKLAEMHSAAN